MKAETRPARRSVSWRKPSAGVLGAYSVAAAVAASAWLFIPVAHLPGSDAASIASAGLAVSLATVAPVGVALIAAWLGQKSVKEQDAVFALSGLLLSCAGLAVTLVSHLLFPFFIPSALLAIAASIRAWPRKASSGEGE